MAQKHRLDQKAPNIITLIVMSSFAAMGAVIFTPALPQMADYFKVSSGHSQLAVTLFLLGYALGQLIYGPLSNYFGRKKAFIIGIVIATLGSILSILAEPLHSFDLLIVGRVFEALGSSAGLVISFAIVNDFYYPKDARKVISYMMLAFAIVPGVSTLIGGLLVTQWHWISCFYFLLIYGLVITLPVFMLAETLVEKDTQALHHRKIAMNYAKLFACKKLTISSLFYGLATMCIYTYAAGAPFIAIHQLGISAQRYGFIGLLPFLGTGLGSIVSAKLSHRLSAKALVMIGMMISTTGILLLAILFACGQVALWSLIGCGAIFMFGGCLIMINCAGLATADIQDKGNASAVMSFTNMMMPVTGTFVIAMIPWANDIKLPIILVAIVIVMQLLYQYAKRLWVDV